MKYWGLKIAHIFSLETTKSKQLDAKVVNKSSVVAAVMVVKTLAEQMLEQQHWRSRERPGLF